MPRLALARWHRVDRVFPCGDGVGVDRRPAQFGSKNDVVFTERIFTHNSSPFADVELPWEMAVVAEFVLGQMVVIRKPAVLGKHLWIILQKRSEEHTSELQSRFG